MRIEVSPSKLHINPIFVASSAIQGVLALYTRVISLLIKRRKVASYVGDKRRAGDIPLWRRLFNHVNRDNLIVAYLICREQEDISTRRIHLVTLSRMNGLF